MPYGYDAALRDRVIKAYQACGSARSSGTRFDVGVATAIRWVRLWRETGSPMDRPRRRKPSVLDPHIEWLLEVRRGEPDLTLQAIADRLRDEHRIGVDPAGLSRLFKKHGVTFKKNPVRQ